MCERITRATERREGHEFRYRLASGFASSGDTVLDAACGTGYGFDLLPGSSNYVGVDRTLATLEVGLVDSVRAQFIEADLCQWEPDFDFDVFVSFETIEHLADYTALIAAAKKAEYWVLLSTPIVPTKKSNSYHVHDFVPGDLRRLMVDDNWRHYQTVQQPSEVAEISVFERLR